VTGRNYRDGEPCEHKGCLNHLSHPCEGCGRIGGVRERGPRKLVYSDQRSEDGGYLWRCNTPGLLEEALKNKGAEMLALPFRIFAAMLGEVAQRAIELGDVKLLGICERLTIIEQDDEEVEQCEN